MLSEYGESITARAAIPFGTGQARASARINSRRRGTRSNEIARRPRARATSPIVPEPDIGSITSWPGREYRRTRFPAHRAGVTPLNDASPARGCPSACVGKSQHVDASRSVRPSIAQAPGGTEEPMYTEARAMASPSPVWVINADGRGGWVKVKICLGPGESRGEEPTDVCEPGVRMLTVPDVQGRAGVRETQRLGDGIASKPGVDVRRVKHVSASRRILDRNRECGNFFGAVRSDPGGPTVSPVDDDLSGTHRTDSAGGLARGPASSPRRHFDLVPEERVHERQGHASGTNPGRSPTERGRGHVPTPGHPPASGPGQPE